MLSEFAKHLEHELDQEVKQYFSLTFAESTKKAYKVHLKAYMTFCQSIQVCPVPASSDTLVKYAAFLARSLKYTSVRQYLNIVRILHLEWGLENPMKDNFSLNCVLKGIRRGLGDSQCRKLPITPELLLKILSKLDLSSAFDCSVWATCLLMFFGMLRRSNVLCPSIRKFLKDKHLSRNDFTFTENSMRLTIRWSKVIQFKDRAVVIEFPRMPGNIICPVTATFRAFQLSVNAPFTGPAFMVYSGKGLTPLTPCMFVKKVQDCLCKAGIEPSQFTAHSFRRGGASWAYNIGIPLETIRQLGDWKSNACLAYISVSTQNVTEALQKMQTSIQT